MDNLNVRVHGSISLDRNVRFFGQVDGDLTISPGHNLELHGRVGRDLIVEEGASATVYGVVGRDVVNKGGSVVVKEAAGRLDDEQDAIVPGVLPKSC
ncbi:hypothetical protein [Rhizobium sp. F40D2]|uniref:hypothetical protein n=1 Tax=Rhizobium sp. F40D2 TaxID=3453141 RepID=UPI003F1EBF6F